MATEFDDARMTDGARRGRDDRGFVAALVVVHALLLALTLSRRLDFLFNDAAHRTGPWTDFECYWRAGHEALLGHGAYEHGPGFGFRYHPLLAAIVGLALSNRSIAVAYGIWVALLEVSYFAVWRSLHGLLPAREFRVASVLLVLFSPYYLEAYMGNASFLVGAMMLAALLLDGRGRPLAATLVAAASAVVKPIGSLLVPWQVLRGRPGHAALATALIVATAAPFFVFGPDSFATFVRVNREIVPPWWVHGGNQGLHCLVVDLACRLTGHVPWEMASLDELPPLAGAVVAWFPFALAALSLVAAWRVRGDAWLCACLLFTTYLLGYKDVWEHSYSFAFLPLLAAWLSGRVPRGLVVAVAVWTALPTAFALYDHGPWRADPEMQWGLGVSVLHHATKPLGMLVLYVASLVAAFRRPRVEASA